MDQAPPSEDATLTSYLLSVISRMREHHIEPWEFKRAMEQFFVTKGLTRREAKAVLRPSEESLSADELEVLESLEALQASMCPAGATSEVTYD